MNPAPVRVPVMVTVLLPVVINPVVMVSVVVETLLANVMPVADVDLFTSKILKVVAPVRIELTAPRSCTVLVPAVNVPELVQLP